MRRHSAAIIATCLSAVLAGLLLPIATAAAATTAPTLSVGDTQVWEGDGYPSQPQATFVVRLSAPTTSDVTFHWTTVDGTATHLVDYVPLSTTSTIPAG